MANITKDELIKIINKRPPGTTPEGIVAALRQQGHSLEGYPTTTQSIATPPEQQKTPLSLTGKFFEGLSGVLGGAKEILQAPQTIATAGLRATGKILGGDPAKEALSEAGREISRIPGEIQRGFGAGVMSPTQQMEPSRVFSEEGITQLAPGTPGGLFVDIFGDPTMLVSLLGNQKARQEVLENSKKAKPFLESFGEDFYKFIKQKPSEFKEEIARIGQEFKGVIQQAPEEIGKDLARFNIKGNLDEMIEQINKRLPKLTKKLDRLADESTDFVKIQPVADKLDDLAARFNKIGKSKTATQITDGINILRDNAKANKFDDLIPVDEALAIKKALDTARQTAKGALSESKKVTENLIFKTIGDELRDQINKIPQLGDVNKEITTLIDGLDAIADIAAKRMSEGGKLPVALNRFFPFVRLRPGALAKAKTEIGSKIIDLSKIIGISPKDIEEALRITLPTTIQNLFD